MIQMKLLSRETMAERGGGDKFEQLFLTLSILIAVEMQNLIIKSIYVLFLNL